MRGRRRRMPDTSALVDASVSVRTAETAEMDDQQQSARPCHGLLLSPWRSSLLCQAHFAIWVFVRGSLLGDADHW